MFTQESPVPPDPRLSDAVKTWEERGFYVQYGEWVAPQKWGKVDSIATAFRRGSWGRHYLRRFFV